MKSQLAGIFLLCVLSASSQVPVMNPIAGPSALCSSPNAASSFTASASNSPSSYSWYVVPSTGVQITGNNNPVVSVSFPQGSGTYTLYCVATNGSGSSQPVLKVITVYETPTVTFSGANNSLCFGSATALMGSPTTQASSSTLSYLWSPSTGLSSTSGYSVLASPTVNTTYTVVVTLGPCTNTYVLPVNVLPAPVLSVGTSNNQLCAGDTATISANGNSVSYSVNNVSSPSSFTVAPTSTSTYVIVGMGANGCSQQQNFVQNVIPKPTIVVSNVPNPMCVGEISSFLLGGTAFGYSVNSVASPSSFTMSPAATSTIQIRGQHSNGCEHTIDHVLTVKPLPTLSVSSTKNPMCKGEVHTITINGNAVTYQVNTQPSQGTFTISPAGTATYVVKGTGQNGCTTQLDFVQNVSLCLGIQQTEKLVSDLLVYPNPASHLVYLKSAQDVDARLYNQLGQEIRHLQLKASKAESIEGLPEGVYFIVAGSNSYRLIIEK